MGPISYVDLCMFRYGFPVRDVLLMYISLRLKNPENVNVPRVPYTATDLWPGGGRDLISIEVTTSKQKTRTYVLGVTANSISDSFFIKSLEE